MKRKTDCQQCGGTITELEDGHGLCLVCGKAFKGLFRMPHTSKIADGGDLWSVFDTLFEAAVIGALSDRTRRVEVVYDIKTGFEAKVEYMGDSDAGSVERSRRDPVSNSPQVYATPQNAAEWAIVWHVANGFIDPGDVPSEWITHSDTDYWIERRRFPEWLKKPDISPQAALREVEAQYNRRTREAADSDAPWLDYVTPKDGPDNDEGAAEGTQGDSVEVSSLRAIVDGWADFQRQSPPGEWGTLNGCIHDIEAVIRKAEQ